MAKSKRQRSSSPPKPPTKLARAKQNAHPPKSPAKRAGGSPGREKAAATATDASLVIVGIGASAGGLEACTALLEALPSNLGAAIVIVQHLAPQHPTMLAELLSPATRMPIGLITDGVRLQPDHVYVVPSNHQASVSGNRLRLTRRPGDASQYKPVDFFFRSLAGADERAIAIVLSGTDSDGAVGIRDVKAAGGIVIAQDPKSAKYDGMPRAAVATGVVDLVLNPAEIGQELVRILRHPFVGGPRVKEGDQISYGDQLLRVFALLRSVAGVDFTHYKQPTIKRRLQRRMVLHKVSGLDQYVKMLQQTPGELRALYQDLLIHVTRFFREPDTYDLLKTRVIPAILERRTGEQPVRIWVPGCSTGEEAYSLAIIFREQLAENPANVAVQIFATDVSEDAIEQARTGLYPENIASDVSPERLRRFFTRSDGNYRVGKMIRDMCVFARQDLTRDPPFSRIDLIVCRNVLIYLGPLLQRRLMNVFHYALSPKGFLLLGAAETVGTYTDLFTAADKKHRLYVKKPAIARSELEFPIDYVAHPENARRTDPVNRASASAIQNEANRLILSRYSPPGVVVDSDCQIIQFRGQTGTFLEPAPGDASLNLLKMLREGLLFGVRDALNEARRRQTTVRKTGLRVKHNGSSRALDVEVIPLTSGGDSRHYVVLFQETIPATAEPAGKSKTKADRPKADENTRRLEQELAANREYLQSIIQDLESANEELQSANEEILSANEELQSTNEELDTAKEELQSTNEELNTVNEELQGRNEEMSRVNSDLINLLASVQIAIVMVASDLRIRRFTPMAEKVLNLLPSDVGRPISHLQPNIDFPDLEKMIATAIESVTPQEREVRDRSGNVYSLRVRPYKNLENRIDGAVLALIEVDVARRQEVLLRDSRDYAEAIVDLVREPLVVLDAELRVQTANRAFLEALGVTREDATGKPLNELDHDRFNHPEVRKQLQLALRSRDKQTFTPDWDGAPKSAAGRLFFATRALPSPDGQPNLLLVLIRTDPD